MKKLNNEYKRLILTKDIEMVMVLKRGSDKKSIEAIFAALLKRKSKSKGIDAHKYCGVIKLDKEPLSIQKAMRSEWD